MKPRNPYATPAFTRKAGVHTSTHKRRGGKRGSKAGNDLEEQLEEYLELKEKENASKKDYEK